MRTLSTCFVILITATLLGSSSFAAEPVRITAKDSPGPLERSLDRALNRAVVYPILRKADMNGEVFVSLVVDKEGKVVVLDCHSTNAELKAYVEEKLSRLDIGDNPEGVWRTTHVRFDFHDERS